MDAPGPLLGQNMRCAVVLSPNLSIDAMPERKQMLQGGIQTNVDAKVAPPTMHRLADSAGFARDSPSADPILNNDAKVAPSTMHCPAVLAGFARDSQSADPTVSGHATPKQTRTRGIQTNEDAKVAPPTMHRLACSAGFARDSPSADPNLNIHAKVAPPTMHCPAVLAGFARDSPSADPTVSSYATPEQTRPDTHRDTEDTHRDTEDTDEKDFASKLVSQCYKSINDRFPSISSNS